MLHIFTGDLGTAEEFENGARRYLNYKRKDGDLSPASVRRKVAAFRSFAIDNGHDGLLRRYKSPPPDPAQPHPLSGGSDTLMALSEATRQPHHKALIGLCGFAGLRVGEAISVMPEHVQIEKMMLKVTGKGSKVRYVPISNMAWACVARAYGNALASETPLVPMSNRAARRAITDIGKRIGITVASHDLRATFATEIYDDTKDVLLVQQLLGHADVNTTWGYIEISDNKKKDAVEFHGRLSQ